MIGYTYDLFRLKAEKACLHKECSHDCTEVQAELLGHAERDIAKGEQLLHTYGDLSDAQLLQTYGFVEDFEAGFENPHNFVPVPAQLLLQSCSESGDEVPT